MKRYPVFFALYLCLMAPFFFPVVAQAQSMCATGIFDRDGATCRFTTGKDAEQHLSDWQVFVGDNGHVYKLIMEQGDVRELYVDGEKIPATQIADFQSFIAPTLKSLLQKKALEKRKADIRAEELGFNSYKLEIEARQIAIEAAQDALETKRTRLEQTASTDVPVSEEQRIDVRREALKLSREQAMLAEEYDAIDQKREVLARHWEDCSVQCDQISEVETAQRAQVLESLIADLKKADVVSNTRALSFKLSGSELVVNGKTMPERLHRTLAAKYLPVLEAGDAGFMYRWKTKQNSK